MSRLSKFAHGLFAGYVQILANILFTLASVPLALRYLSKEEFAIWALVTQIGSYFALVDLGLSSSVSRILADYKDDRNGGKYGGVMKAGLVFFCGQGMLIALATWYGALPLANVFGIGPEWQDEFVYLLRGYGVLMAFNFATRIWGAPFWCFQRYDVGNYSATVGFALQFACTWGGFAWGMGIKSLLLAYVAQNILVASWNVIAGWRLGFFPARGAWGRIESRMLRELFAFGRDVFLMSVGAQLLSASQIMIVTRLLGLEAAATWAICSKIFTLAQQMIAKILESSAGAFAEMFVRAETERLKQRYRDVTVLTASTGVVVGVMMATANSSFVAVWTHGRVQWSLLVDLLLGLLLVTTSVSRCLVGIAGITKEISLLRFIYFLEGISFLLLAWVLGARYEFAGVAMASILANTVWSGIYGFARARQQWHCTTREIASWLGPAGAQLVFLLPTAWICVELFAAQPPLARFLCTASLMGAVSIAVLWSIGIPKALRREMIERIKPGRGATEAL